MALPPEPLEDVLPLAAAIVVGEVTAVADLGPWPAPRGAAIDAAPPSPAQQITLKLRRVLRGAPGTDAELVVLKPQGSYALRPGVQGAFLLDATSPVPHILGRYGPDTYAVEQIEEALVLGARGAQGEQGAR